MLPPEPAVSQRSLARWQTSARRMRRACREAVVMGRNDYRPCADFSNSRRLLVAATRDDGQPGIAQVACVVVGSPAAPEAAAALVRADAGPATARAQPDVGIEIPGTVRG